METAGVKNAAADEAGGDAKRRKEAGAAASDSESEADDPDVLKIVRKLQGKETEEDLKENEKAASSDSSSNSSSSSSSSTTSSSSSSSSSDEDDDGRQMETFSGMGDEEDGDEEADMTEDERFTKDFQTCKSAVLTRKELLWVLAQLPQEEAHAAIKRAWVRITIQADVCVLAKVTDLVEMEEPYFVDAPAAGSGKQLVKVALRCIRCMPPERDYKIVNISNKEITKEEFDQWTKLVKSDGMDLEGYRLAWKDKARDILKAKGYQWNEDNVNAALKRKKNKGIDMEFDSQKESRLRAERHSMITQMAYCGLKENRATELEQRGRHVQSQMDVLKQKGAKHQEEWFDQRPNMYSIAEINKKNKDRQVARDKFALDHTYAMEEVVEEAKRAGKKVEQNVFERRACRPVSAWDTKLTIQEGGLDDGLMKKLAKKEDKAKAAEAAKAAATQGDSAAGKGPEKKATERSVDMRVHRQLWSLIAADRGSTAKVA